jgi:hypothetical protein
METAAPASSVRQPATARWIGASIIGLLALLFVAAGISGLWARFGTSEHGWITSGSHRYATSGRAIDSGSLDADGIPDWLVAKVRVSAASDDGAPIFVGVGRRADVDRYLAGVAHSTIEDVNFDPFDPTYSSTRGSVVPASPAAQTFWAQSKVGTGTQTVSWKIRDGHWRVVVMNADGSPSVVTDAKVAATFRGELPIAISILGVGVALLACAVALGMSAARRSS